MKNIDLHGKTVKEAEAVFDEYLNRARMERQLIEIQFITGNGKIQTRLKELVKLHDIHSYVPLNNAGCIVIEFQ